MLQRVLGNLTMVDQEQKPLESEPASGPGADSQTASQPNGGMPPPGAPPARAPGEGHRRRRRRRRRRHHFGPDASNAPAPVAAAASQRVLSEIELAARRLGIPRLYPEQERVIEAVLAGRDVLVVLPTGFGKSACYQIPSMILPEAGGADLAAAGAAARPAREAAQAQAFPACGSDGTVRGKPRREALETDRTRRLAAGDDHAGDARLRRGRRRRCASRASVWRRSTKRTASPSGATISAPRTSRSASACASSARRRSWR